MTDITDLAKEIQHSMHLMETAAFANPDAQLKLNIAALELVNMVCNDTPSRCFYRGYEFGVKEQKEKDAQIVIEMGKYQDPEKVAKAIRDS